MLTETRTMIRDVYHKGSQGGGAKGYQQRVQVRVEWPDGFEPPVQQDEQPSRWVMLEKGQGDGTAD